MSPRSQRFVFDNYGGSYQLRIRTVDDLQALEYLDEPFWVATSAPADQLRSDPNLVRRLDRDGDGRILSSDIRAAVQWMMRVLKNREGVNEGRETLRLDDLDVDGEEGRGLREAAERILHNVGKIGDAEVHLDVVRDRSAILARGAQNGDGVIPPSSATEDPLRAFIQDIMSTTGSVRDLNGEKGVNEELLDCFLGDAGALREWRRQRSAGSDENMFPLGEGTASGYALLESLREPIDKYFELCKVVGLNRALGRETRQPESPPEVFRDAEAREAYLREAPIARPRPEPVLPFEEDVNPVYADELLRFRDTVVQPILGGEVSGARLSEDDWDSVRNAFGTYAEWLKSKRGGAVEALGPDKLNAYLSGTLPDRLRKMIEEDRAVGPQIAAMENLEYLILLQRWILETCNNFVSFPYLYDPDHRASFEEGRMIMDGKIFNLNMRVEDVDGHSVRAERSGIYLMYSEVTRGEPQEKFHIVTPVAHVDLGNLGVDKRGVLFDRDGHEWDVRVTKVVENVVSVKQAVLAPFRRAGEFLKDTMSKISGSAEQQVKAQVLGAPAPAPGAPPAAGAPKPASSSLRDLVLAGGISVAALGTSFAYIGKTLGNPETVLRTFAVIAVVILILLIPVVLFALYKLYIRNLSSVLEASGWAINARMRLTFAISRIICIRPRRPRDRFVISHEDVTRLFSYRHKSLVRTKPQDEE